jgi:hypothetical protein
MRKVDKPWIIPMSLCFLLTFFETWDEIPFKGVELSHPEISNFRM